MKIDSNQELAVRFNDKHKTFHVSRLRFPPKKQQFLIIFPQILNITKKSLRYKYNFKIILYVYRYTSTKNHFMKIFKLFTPVILAIVLFSTGSQIASCVKETIIRDTITIIKKDTLTIIDSSACYDLKDGLVAWYNFNNGGLKDSSGNNNDIIFNTAAKTTDRFGKANNAYSFNGSSSYMKANNSTSLNPQKISIMAIVKISGFYSGTCHANNILSKGTPDYVTGFYYLRFEDTDNNCNTTDFNKEVFRAGFGDNNGTYARSDTNFVKTNQWYNVIYTYDGVDSKLYINGVLKDVKRQAAQTTGNSDELFIGRHKDNSNAFPYWFNGAIDEIRVYNKALCAGEIKLLNTLTD
jgi:hypothetical protein